MAKYMAFKQSFDGKKKGASKLSNVLNILYFQICKDFVQKALSNHSVIKLITISWIKTSNTHREIVFY